MTIGTADVNGATLHYEILGEGHPLILLHAGVADSRMWDAQIEDFARYFRVLRYDRRGSGKSPMPAGSYYDADDLLTLLAMLNIHKAYCLGLSRGASVALEFTLEHQDQVDALILAAPGASGNQPSEELKAKIAVIDEAAESGDIALAVELEIQLWVDGPKRRPEQVNQAVRSLVTQMNTNNFMLENSAAQSRRPAQSPMTEAHRIHVPTLVLVGNGDQPDIIRNADGLAASVVGARKVVFPDVAHLFNMEIPQVFNQTVLDFLTSLPQ